MILLEEHFLTVDWWCDLQNIPEENVYTSGSDSPWAEHRRSQTHGSNSAEKFFLCEFEFLQVLCLSVAL